MGHQVIGTDNVPKSVMRSAVVREALKLMVSTEHEIQKSKYNIIFNAVYPPETVFLMHGSAVENRRRYIESCCWLPRCAAEILGRLYPCFKQSNKDQRVSCVSCFRACPF